MIPIHNYRKHKGYVDGFPERSCVKPLNQFVPCGDDKDPELTSESDLSVLSVLHGRTNDEGKMGVCSYHFSL